MIDDPLSLALRRLGYYPLGVSRSAPPVTTDAPEIDFPAVMRSFAEKHLPERLRIKAELEAGRITEEEGRAQDRAIVRRTIVQTFAEMRRILGEQEPKTDNGSD